MYLLEVGVVSGVLSKAGYNSFYMQVDEVVDGTFLEFMVLVRVGTDDSVFVCSGVAFNTVEHRGIVMGYQVWYYYSNDMWRFLTQTLCEGVRAIVQFLCQLLYALPHFLANFVAVSKGSADGCNADIELLCQVF